MFYGDYKIRLPSAGKEDGPGALITSNQYVTCAETRTEEEETIRITLPRKKNATSHHKVDFYATKDLPLASTENKKYIGSLKIQIHNKSAKQAESPATEIGKELPSIPMHAEASGGVNEDVSHNAGEILKAICVDDVETKLISAEEHKNKEKNSTSAPAENTPLKTFPDAHTGRPEENSSLGIVSTVLHTKAEVDNQSFPIKMLVSGINSSEIDVPTENVKVHKADIVATTSDLDLPVPLAGVGLQNREIKENTSLPLNILIFETAESEIEKGAPTKNVNEQKAVQDDAKGEIPQLVQQNTPNVEHQDIEVKDTTLSQKIQASATEVSDVKDTNSDHAGDQKDRQSAAVVKIAQQSPPKPQPRVIKDVGSPESPEMSETTPEIKGEVLAKSDSKRSSDLGAGKAELAQESSPVLQINDSKAQSTFPELVQSLKSTVHEMKKDTNANFISEQQECLGVIMAEGTLPVQLSSSKTQQRETKVKDTSPQCIVNVSVTEKEAFTICSTVEKSGTDTLTSDVLPFQKSMIDSACKEKEIQNTASLCVKASKITMHEIKTDTMTDVVSDTELGPNEATVEFALPLELNTTMLQNNNSEIKATILLGAEMNNKASANSSNELNTLTSDDIIPPMQKEVVNLQYREANVNDIPVCAETSITVSKIRNDVTENGAGDTVTSSTAARGELALPAEQNVSTLENRGFEIIEAALPQSLETSRSTGSKINKGFSSTAAFEQKAGSENAMNNFGQPVLSSTPKILHNETKLKRAAAASSVETPAGNLPRTEDSQTADSTAKELELGAATNQFSLPVQNTKESQLREPIVKEASVVDDSWTTKAIVDPNGDLDSLTNVFASFVPQTASKSEANGLNVSFNEGSSLDSSSDMESFTETIRKYGNPINLPQKKQRVPKVPFVPPFAMPPIQEDRTSPKKEKTFDPSSFRCGLMKNRYTNKAPLSLLKLQQTETKSKVVKRVSAEQSLLFKSLTNKSSRSRVSKQKNAENDPASPSDSKRSRLEVDETLAQTSNPSAEPVIEPADLTPPLLRNDVVEEFKFDLSNPSFPETQLPKFMENNLEVSTSELEDKSDNSEKQSENGLTIPDLKTNLLEINTDFTGITNTCALDNIPTFLGSSTVDDNQNPLSLFNADLFTPNFVLPNLPEVGVPETRELTLNSRPGKIVIYNQCNLCGEAIEVFHDVKDATSWKLGREISIRVVRGCWLIYQKPNFEGDKIALEDDVLELSEIWGQEVAEDNCDDAHISSPKESRIGSLRRIVKMWSLPEIELCTGLHGFKRKTAYVDDVEEVQTYGVPEPTLSLEVYSGAWLLFEEPFYQGNSYFVEPGQYPCPEHWGAMDPFIGSLRPLKMGTLKVEMFKDNKVIVYEKPFFEGKQLELKTDVFSFVEGDEETAVCHTYPFANIGSLKVIGGFWVGYEKPGFQGHQYVLEEGEYQEWNDWGGYDEHLQSLRFIQVNLSSPVMIMYNERNFSENGGNIEVLGPVPDLQDTDHGLRTESINVLSGTWVAYENTDFTGEQYVLEMGLYTSYEDWGATNSKISSIQPVLLDVMDSELSKFEVQFFSEPEFQGSANVFDTDTSQFPAGFSPKSCKVKSGSWVAYDAENFTGNQYILEEESYSDLVMIGCASDVHIKSVKTVGFCFSIPAIILFQREKFEGKKIEMVSEMRKLSLKGYNNHIFSVQVIGGTWVAYECSNYKGRQILLQPCQIPNWHQHTGWHRIGSLRPLIQSRVYFRIRNRGTGMFLTFVGELNEISMVRVQAVEGTGMDDQIWFYQDGFIKTKMAEDCCLDVVGSFFGQNSRLGISVEDSEDIQSWNISSDGVILNGIRTDLVIDIKGGQQYDQSQTILNIFDEVQPTQRWDLEIL
ncbi:beta/gamma crystallin domain-containing protein 1 [Scyliorhinus canicula]|uniref:beta/gamma crystallin domain-containing protein 1 n=1 Tax=Scyliorhinus canicula TaxID=7830 RepID=UPI0018F62835|nr:beta/gamma crystallin domain-containing protein 1 [Scyliorhinus canicula]